MRAFVTKLTLIFVPVAVMLAANVFYDPVHIVREGPERDIASMLIAGRRVGGIVNYDERRLVAYCLQQMSQPRDVVVLGSSRAMQIRDDQFPGETMFNASVSTATVADLAAIIGEHARRHLLPRRMIIELDATLLDRSNRSDLWRAMASGYDEVRRATGLPPGPTSAPRLDRFFVLLSPVYFQQTVREIRARRSLRTFQPFAVISDDGGAVLPDGSRVYPRSVRDRTAAQLEGMAVAGAALMRSDDRYTHFKKIDDEAAGELAALFAFLTSRGTDVALFLGPLHPTMIGLLRESGDYAVFEDAARTYHAIAAQLHLPLGGSFDGAAAGCAGAEFYDPDHPREPCVNRIVHAIQ